MRNKNDLIWGFSLLVIGIVTLILAGSGMIGIDLPDVAVRILGIITNTRIPPALVLRPISFIRIRPQNTNTHPMSCIAAWLL